MATLRAPARASEENAPRAKDGKANIMGGTGADTRRRALGDIGNIQGVTTRSQAAKEKASGKPQTSLRPRDPNATATALRSRVTSQAPKPAGLSLSKLLQSRSEEAAAAKNASSPPPASPAPDIDSQDKGNPLSAYEYAGSIYNYYRRVEPRFQVSPEYMASQVDINAKMRAILVDWLVEVHLKFKLMPETLYLTCNLIDRYLAHNNVARKRLQLVGVTAMLIASKYEEIWAPEVRDFVYISDKAYTREEILNMEKQMLQKLQYDLTVPTAYNFLARFKKAANVQDVQKVAQLCEYMSELCLVDFKMLEHPVSLVSAACLHVALLATNHADTYPRALMKHSRYTLQEVMPCARRIVELMNRAGTTSLKAVFKKYNSPKFGEAAKVPVPVLLENL